ncbi:MAG: LysO family transporter [Thermoplasmata archaeon]
MVAIDPGLYLAFGLGYLAGRWSAWRGPWLGRSVFGTIFALVFVLGDAVAPTPLPELLATIPLAAAFALVLLAVTAVVAWGARPSGVSRAAPTVSRPYLGVLFLGALLMGYGMGRFEPIALSPLLTPLLYLLLFLVAFDLKFSYESLRRIAVPVSAALVGAGAAAAALALFAGMDWRLSLATSFAFGWYSLVGPLAAARIGAAAGLVAFLANFFRENMTMILAPVVGPRAGPEVLTAMGGATSMDTTLYFVIAYGDREAGTLAFGSGLMLTLLASLILPVILSLPPPAVGHINW